LEKPDKSRIEVCHGPRCSDYGGKALRKDLRANGIDSCMVLCQSLCTYSPVVKIDGNIMLHVTTEDILKTIDR
jgi:NADH:ubiquinone oxidoreductase subunit E